MDDKKSLPHFHFLTPDLIMRLAEYDLGIRLTSLCRPYKSYINRVYELQTQDGTGIVAKFYRPGRWTKRALLDEHTFLCELADAEIPVIAPLSLKNGSTLGDHEGTYYAFFPKKGGRNCDEFTPDQWLEIGRLLGRVHAVGALEKPLDRLTFTPEKATNMHLDYIIKGGFLPADIEKQYHTLVTDLIGLIQPLFHSIPLLRIHGDCFFANIIYRPGESFYLIDFDDMVMGPSIQDLWMLLPGYVRDSRQEIALFIEGYETFRSFNHQELKLIEPLRAMRYIHFTAWCAHQITDGGFSSLAPGWGTRAFWQTECNDLREQIEHIKKDEF